MTYLANYKLYLASLSALRQEFWDGVKRQNVSGQRDVTVWGNIKVEAEPKPKTWSVQADGLPVQQNLRSEEEALLYAAARCGEEGAQALISYAKSPKGELAPLKAVTALKDVRVVPGEHYAPPVSWATITKVSPPVQRTPPKQPSPAVLETKKAQKAARRKRAKAKKALLKTEERTRLLAKKLELNKMQASLENWTLVENKKKAKLARQQKRKQSKVRVGAGKGKATAKPAPGPKPDSAKGVVTPAPVSRPKVEKASGVVPGPSKPAAETGKQVKPESPASASHVGPNPPGKRSSDPSFRKGVPRGLLSTADMKIQREIDRGRRNPDGSVKDSGKGKPPRK